MISGYLHCYNTNGMRTQKKVGSKVTDYYYDSNNNLIAEKTDNATLFFYYDTENSPVALSYNGKMFYYVKNLQGDIVKILDEDGNEKANYVYNAWGNILSQSNDELSSINPLRYRGYVYDEDTAMYYLQTRYYDPFTGRFINADNTVFIGSSGTAIGDNIFTYCENDPVNNVDYTGQWFYSLKKYYDYNFKKYMIISPILWYNFLESYEKLCKRNKYNKNCIGKYSSYIYGQANYPVSNMKYGKSESRISNVGCELVAIYNALKKMKKFMNFSQIILEAEMNDLVWYRGKFGTHPRKIGRFFDAHKIIYVQSNNIYDFKHDMNKYKIGIISKWNNDSSTGIHTFFVVKKSKDKCWAYNYTNNARDTKVVDLTKIKSWKFVVGYCFT